MISLFQIKLSRNISNDFLSSTFISPPLFIWKFWNLERIWNLEIWKLVFETPIFWHFNFGNAKFGNFHFSPYLLCEHKLEFTRIQLVKDGIPVAIFPNGIHKKCIIRPINFY